jgi:hypothetical protein
MIDSVVKQEYNYQLNINWNDLLLMMMYHLHGTVMSDLCLNIYCSCVCISTLLQCWNFLRNIRSDLVLCVILLPDFSSSYACQSTAMKWNIFQHQKRIERETSWLTEKVVDMSELYTDIMRRSSKDGIPRASSLSSIDSIMTPSRMSGGDLDTTVVAPMLALNHLSMCVA